MKCTCKTWPNTICDYCEKKPVKECSCFGDRCENHTIEKFEELKAQNLRMAYWIIDTVDSELDPEECQDDCAYQDALEILGLEKRESL